MISVLGTYECKVDAKGRFMFPVQFKNQMGDKLKRGFVIKRSIFKKCLELFPVDQSFNAFTLPVFLSCYPVILSKK